MPDKFEMPATIIVDASMSDDTRYNVYEQAALRQKEGGR